MYLTMLDFFQGMGKEFALDAMAIADKMTKSEGKILFNKGDRADHFYVLTKGRIRLTIGPDGPEVYVARQKGEIIGWSCLIARADYSASAQCLQTTDLVRFNRRKFLRILKMYPANELLLFRRIAHTLGNRLLELYPTIS